jgi:hypothetical protein
VFPFTMCATPQYRPLLSGNLETQCSLKRTNVEQEGTMKKITHSLVSVFMLLGLVTGMGSAQNQVLAQHGGYQLTDADLAPSVEFLNFLIQGELTQDELVYLVQHSAHEFQKNPAEFLNTTQQIAYAVNQLKALNDPVQAAGIRQQTLNQAAAFVNNTPQHEWPASYQLLFKRAPVVAYDTNTGMVLTQQDLVATVQYMAQAYINQGYSVSQQDMEQTAVQIAGNFSGLDQNSQMVLGSGTIMLQIYQQYPQLLASSTQPGYNQSYNYNQATTTGGPPAGSNYNSYSDGGYNSYSDAARHKAVDQQIMNTMYDNMNQNHAIMMNHFESDPNVEWTYNPGSW